VLTRVLYLLGIGGALGACVRDKPSVSPPAASTTAVASLPPAPTTAVASLPPAPTTETQRGRDSVRFDLRSGCSALADAAKRNGSGEILFSDTLLAADRFTPRQIVCRIRAQGFGAGGVESEVIADSLSASGWRSWEFGGHHGVSVRPDHGP